MEQPPNLRELYTVAGSAPDPHGGSARGMQSEIDLTGGALGHPQIVTPYKTSDGTPIVLEVDVYDDHVHMHCPVCLIEGRGEHGLRIRKDAKDWGYDLADPRGLPGWTSDQLKVTFPRGLGGTLSVEPFACTWEEVGDLKRGYGLQRCSFKASIDNNVLRPA